MSVGTRLKEERVRLGLSQPAFAALAGASKGAQAKWEKDAASPNAVALQAFAKAGADVLYVLTGKRTIDPPISDTDHASAVLEEAKTMLIDQSSSSQLDDAIDLLKKVVAWDGPANLNSELMAEARTLLDLAEDATKLSDFRAAAFAQKHRARELAKEGLATWLKRWPYKPNEAVMKQIVNISIEYHVPYEPLVELLHEIYEDIKRSYR